MSSSTVRQRGGASKSGSVPQASGKAASPSPPRPSPVSPVILGIVALVAAGVAFFFYSSSTRSSGLAGGEVVGNTFNRYPLPEKGWVQAKAEVVTAIQDSYRAYADSDAWGCDDFFPEHGSGGNLTSGGSIGYFIVDVLDTLLLTPGMDVEYARAKEYVRNLSFDIDGEFNAFETTIRVLGGLLSAYSLDGEDPVYLEKALDLGNRLMPIFDTPTGIPLSFINLKTREASSDKKNHGYSSLAEATSLQLEFKYLAEISGEPKFWKVAEKTMTAIRSSRSLDGLLPILVHPDNGHFFFHIRVGSRGDSYYEMLLKQYLQTARLEPVYKEMHELAYGGIKTHLIKETEGGLAYTGELHPKQTQKGFGGYTFVPKQDHLVCFLGGSFLLSVTEGQGPLLPSNVSELSEEQQEDWLVGKELVRTCVDTYEKSATGLGAEIVQFGVDGQVKLGRAKREWAIAGYGQPNPPLDARNILRPETVESLFLAWRATHDVIYREWGYQIFKAFEEHCRLPINGAYTSIIDVDALPVERENKMETFWLSETLKYLLLLFSDDSVVPLDQYVLNTEAHILPVFEPTVVDLNREEIWTSF